MGQVRSGHMIVMGCLKQALSQVDDVPDYLPERSEGWRRFLYNNSRTIVGIFAPDSFPESDIDKMVFCLCVSTTTTRISNVLLKRFDIQDIPGPNDQVKEVIGLALNKVSGELNVYTRIELVRYMRQS